MKKKMINISLFLSIISLVLTIITSANTIVINNDNTPPNPPEITGPTSGKIREYYTYYVTLTDPDEDDYLSKLEIDFGDGVLVEECGCNRPWENGEVLEVQNMWKKTGTYEVKGRVMDVHGAWSDWSDPLSVTMPRNKMIHNNLKDLFQRFSLPIIEKIFFNLLF